MAVTAAIPKKIFYFRNYSTALGRADSEHSIGSVEDVVVSTSSDRGTTTTTRTSRHHGTSGTHQRTSTVTHHEPVVTRTTTLVRETHEPGVSRTVTTRRAERSFLDSSTKVSGVQDILTRMKNADIGKTCFIIDHSMKILLTYLCT